MKIPQHRRGPKKYCDAGHSEEERACKCCVAIWRTLEMMVFCVSSGRHPSQSGNSKVTCVSGSCAVLTSTRRVVIRVCDRSTWKKVPLSKHLCAHATARACTFPPPPRAARAGTMPASLRAHLYLLRGHAWWCGRPRGKKLESGTEICGTSFW